ncbi:nucleotidyltransferase family protein [Kamptonema formosum]|uniref:nucleotidyltransferase family protein n=1 Tax=Kamptonema formosum TaxID=331992 RepID=UPI0003457DA0|nr:nucleotidyltransferase [Oscillatoria sp. PCC 10802]
MALNLNLLRAKREEILKLAAQNGAYNVRIYGPVARGEVPPNGDVDFLVELEPDRNLLDLGGFLMDLQELLGSEVHVTEEEGLRQSIRYGKEQGERINRVLKEAVVV